MRKRASNALLLALVVGCGAPPAAPTIRVPAAAATTTEAKPCPEVRRHRLPCDLDPPCRGLRGNTPLERECSQLQTIDFNIRRHVDDPCSLLSMAALMDDLLEVNAPAVLTTPAVVAAAAEYRASLIESRDAARALAEALQHDPAAVPSARKRLLEAADRDDSARPRRGLACP